jgi:hypothetical protein
MEPNGDERIRETKRPPAANRSRGSKWFVASEEIAGRFCLLVFANQQGRDARRRLVITRDLESDRTPEIVPAHRAIEGLIAKDDGEHLAALFSTPGAGSGTIAPELYTDHGKASFRCKDRVTRRSQE